MKTLLRLLLAIPLFAAAASCAPPVPGGTPVAALPPLTPGTGRIVIYRPVEYYGPSDVLTVALKGGAIGTVWRGELIFRDVPPGPYMVSFSPTGPYYDQFKTMLVEPGNVFYVKLQALPQNPCDNPFLGGVPCRDNTYTSTIVDPAMAQSEMRGLRMKQG